VTIDLGRAKTKKEEKISGGTGYEELVNGYELHFGKVHTTNPGWHGHNVTSYYYCSGSWSQDSKPLVWRRGLTTIPPEKGVARNQA
jgi:hypothetical protein